MAAQSTLNRIARAAASLCLALILTGMSAGTGPTFAQAVSPASLPFKVINQPLVAFIAARKHLAPNTVAKFTTAAARKTQFTAMVGALADRKWTQVALFASQLSYAVVALKEAGKWFVIAYDPHGRDPIVVINLNPSRELIAGAPHVPFEPGTGEQAVILLRDVAGRAAIVSGAHRCASATHTTCDGTTAVCGTLEAYRDSDPGHNIDTLYHVAHVVLAARWPKTIVMSLHGMAEDTGGVKTSLVVSNGIKADDNTKKTAATRLRVRLATTITPTGAVVSCNLSSDDKARSLCGQNNVQGRHVNGDADACHGGVTQGTGRFIHLEQDHSVRDPFADDWQHIFNYPIYHALVSGLQSVVPQLR